MTRSRITAAVLGLGLITAFITPALAQSPPPTVVVPPSASPTTVITPSPGGTTVVAPPGSTVTVTPPPAPAAIVAAKPWCGGAYGAPGGSNFGSCPGYFPR